MTKLGMDFDRLIGMRPSNREAAMSGNGGKGRPLDTQAASPAMGQDEPFALRPITSDIRGNPAFVDLTGSVFGRLTFLGLARDYSHPARWVARCVCGKYVLRRAKLALDERYDRCVDCAYTQELRERAAKPGASR